MLQSERVKDGRETPGARLGATDGGRGRFSKAPKGFRSTSPIDPNSPVFMKISPSECKWHLYVSMRPLVYQMGSLHQHNVV